MSEAKTNKLFRHIKTIELFNYIRCLKLPIFNFDLNRSKRSIHNRESPISTRKYSAFPSTRAETYSAEATEPNQSSPNCTFRDWSVRISTVVVFLPVCFAALYRRSCFFIIFWRFERFVYDAGEVFNGKI